MCNGELIDKKNNDLVEQISKTQEFIAAKRKEKPVSMFSVGITITGFIPLHIKIKTPVPGLRSEIIGDCLASHDNENFVNVFLGVTYDVFYLFYSQDGLAKDGYLAFKRRSNADILRLV